MTTISSSDFLKGGKIDLVQPAIPVRQPVQNQALPAQDAAPKPGPIEGFGNAFAQAGTNMQQRFNSISKNGEGSIPGSTPGQFDRLDTMTAKTLAGAEEIAKAAVKGTGSLLSPLTDLIPKSVTDAASTFSKFFQILPPGSGIEAKFQDLLKKNPEQTMATAQAMNIIMGALALSPTPTNIADVVTGGIDAGASVASKVKGLVNPEPSITLGGQKLNLSQVHGEEGTKLFENLSFADQQKFTAFDKVNTAKQTLENAIAKGAPAEDVTALKSMYEGELAASQRTAPSVASYIDSSGNKVFTKLTPEEYNVLKNEVKNIPQQADGASQLHLDPLNSKLVNGGAKEVSRDQFLAGHPQAAEMFSNAGTSASAAEKVAIGDATPNYEASTPTQRQKLLGRVQEGGTFKGRTVKPTALETEAGQELSKVPGYDPNSTKLQKYQVAKAEIATRGEALSSSLQNEKIIVPKKEIVSKVRTAINDVPEQSLLLQKSDPVIKNYIRVVNNAVNSVDGNLKGVLDLRKNLDAVYENARGKAAFGSDKIAALDEVHTAARDTLTQYLIDHAAETDVKASLRGQWNLYRALDQLQIAAEKESGSSVGRLIQKYPITSKVVEKGARAVGLGTGISIVK